ncbi:RrF2 family transcriptional regulator [Mammaliicoccus stepanovicii]|uniref:HTH-type transcriptional regulator NsrR n=1 Tax=Mammaliicoccus stepanovicii TaxID=643214 RepID=A0A239ZRD9_9STAP|nr:Rrf2 family transcriptional regulator [Mammaliicoccus stepanovicii]PNZ76922.1 BadM/Rrf2 family transcriptional regulator [Mammaliicoccus stepanovicii]GGI41365.1 HTH-type transcriptional regulator NsrR [Mammaliicoccus stepanovicii]SNV73176.1 transcriptional regulator [Mammaliicoccus stepanovicii]
MKLTQYTDYSLRVLMYLAQQNKQSQIEEIANFYDISKNHLTKIVHQLVKLGYVNSVRGRNGGISLNLSPDEINIGSLVRKTEEHFELVECFNMETNTCPLASHCGLQIILNKALQEYLLTLDKYSLKDILPKNTQNGTLYTPSI